MKKIIIIICCLFFACCTVVQAKELGVISVSSEVTQNMAPNCAQFNITVEKSNVDQAVAVSTNNIVMKNITDALKTKMQTTDGRALQTSSLSVYPHYIKEDGQQRIDKYIAKSVLTVSVDNLSQISDLVALAIKNGATSVGNLSFSIKNQGAYCDNLLKQANMENLRKANSIASTMGLKVDSLKHVTANCSHNTSIASKMSTINAESDSVSIPIEKGTIKVYARVDSEFYVK